MCNAIKPGLGGFAECCRIGTHPGTQHKGYPIGQLYRVPVYWDGDATAEIIAARASDCPIHGQSCRLPDGTVADLMVSPSGRLFRTHAGGSP